jgi:hypothetical protein
VSWHTHKIRGSRNRNREREREREDRIWMILEKYKLPTDTCVGTEYVMLTSFNPILILCFGNREKQRMKQSSVLERFRYKSQREREIWLLEQRVDVVPRCEVRGPWRSLVPLFFFFFYFLNLFIFWPVLSHTIYLF